MSNASEPPDAGPASYRNWRARIDGARMFNVFEVPFYSDAHITGEVSDGLGPYNMRNGLPADPSDPAIVLTIEWHLNPGGLPPMDKTDTANFTGAWLGDEIAALVALAFGARIMAGAQTRFLREDGKTWGIMGDRMRPIAFPKAS